MKQKENIFSTKGSKYNYIGAFLSGAIVSGIATLLIARQKGSQTRKGLKDRISRMMFSKQEPRFGNQSTEKYQSKSNRKYWRRNRKSIQGKSDEILTSKAVEMVNHLKNAMHH